MYSKLKKALYKKKQRKAKKGKERLMQDGLPYVLTSDEFVELVHKH
jgi:hypothetical protein